MGDCVCERVSDWVVVLDSQWMRDCVIGGSWDWVNVCDWLVVFKSGRMSDCVHGCVIDWWYLRVNGWPDCVIGWWSWQWMDDWLCVNGWWWMSDCMWLAGGFRQQWDTLRKETGTTSKHKGGGWSSLLQTVSACASIVQGNVATFLRCLRPNESKQLARQQWSVALCLWAGLESWTKLGRLGLVPEHFCIDGLPGQWGKQWMSLHTLWQRRGRYRFPAALDMLTKEKGIARNKRWLHGMPGVEQHDVDCMLGFWWTCTCIHSVRDLRSKFPHPPHLPFTISPHLHFFEPPIPTKSPPLPFLLQQVPFFPGALHHDLHLENYVGYVICI